MVDSSRGWGTYSPNYDSAPSMNPWGTHGSGSDVYGGGWGTFGNGYGMNDGGWGTFGSGYIPDGDGVYYNADPFDLFAAQAAEQEAAIAQSAAANANPSGAPFGSPPTAPPPPDAFLSSPDGPEYQQVNQWDTQIWDAANQVYAQTGVWVDPNRIKAHMMIESGGAANAVQNNPTGNAYGLMQVTANSSIAPYLISLMGSWDAVAERLVSDPDFAVWAGAMELAAKYSQYQDWNKASEAYFGINAYDSVSGTDTATYMVKLNENLNALNAAGPSYTQQAPPEGSGEYALNEFGGYTIEALFGGIDAPISQEIGDTKWHRDNPGLYEYAEAYGFYGHPGLDFGVPKGTVVYAPVGGTVIINGMSGSFNDSMYGGVGEIRFRMPDGDEIIYGHMNTSFVTMGQTIAPGQAVGTTGGENGDHLHLEVRDFVGYDEQGQPMYRIVDPRVYFGTADGSYGSGTYGYGSYEVGSDGKPRDEFGLIVA